MAGIVIKSENATADTKMKREDGPKLNQGSQENRNHQGQCFNNKNGPFGGPKHHGNQGSKGKGGTNNGINRSNTPKPAHGFGIRGSSFRGGNKEAGYDGSLFGSRGGRSGDDRFMEKIAQLSQSTIILPPIEGKEPKFSGRCRLYIGNLTTDTTVEELVEMFTPYGETSEEFINAEKMFGFIRLDYIANAEKAKRELDGSMKKGRPIRVRFAPNTSAIKVKNLNQWVSNELLDFAFQPFGEIERAVVITDERGKSTGEGIVEFARKPAAMMALRKCEIGCFFLTASLRPVLVEPFDFKDDTDGYPDKNFRKTPDFFREREIGPRFVQPGSFEYEYGNKWKQLHELYKQKMESLQRELKMEEEKLEAQMEFARFEHETEKLREQLRQREQDKERQKREWELKERQVEEQRKRDKELMKRQSEEMQLRIRAQEDEVLRRRQENSLFMQAHQLSSILDQQEQNLGFDNNRSHSKDRDYQKGTSKIPSLLDSQDAKTFFEQYERGGSNSRNERQSTWGTAQERRGPPSHDFAAKKRRY